MTCLLPVMIVLRVIQPREYTNSVTGYNALPESCGLDVFSLNNAEGNKLERTFHRESVSENALFHAITQPEHIG